ncbi:linear gramicidin synthetase subunit B [Xenorhabdus mauleonii]|uniref:Amino acid adenylation domain-containing protein n=1 Tax=Xenorhabdus mauleonii TaxID=351675 RepID=A0A1I3T4B1_9GAMM|nr:non-ribosomal peptide synthetase [Xenorhabdus mauleonii]PHM44696.1 linear gramicidin synthetase subunit B [Xenorhabdus mauleonii]SFJ64516.1 amino acid adenylation domain-containing protein [Xenorhabdus mauleonii]
MQTKDSLTELKTCADLFTNSVATSNSLCAIHHDGITLTYKELAEKAGAVAQLLISQGVVSGDVVAIFMERSATSLIAALAIWAVGAAYIQLEASEPDGRITDLIERAGVTKVLTDDSNYQRIALYPYINLDKQTLEPQEYLPVSGRKASDLAYFVSTSGSTGVPKLVAIEHSSIMNYVSAFVERISPMPCNLMSTTTFASDLGNTSIFGALLTGRTLELINREVMLDPIALANYMNKYSIEMLKCTPSQLEILSKEGNLKELLPEKVLIIGGEELTASLAKDLLAAKPNLRIFNHYGPSETTIGVLMHSLNGSHLDEGSIPIGQPLSGVEIRVLNDAKQPVLPGEIGQLYIGGRALARGYHGDQELTKTHFIDISGSRFYASGDLVKQNVQGDYVFIGRVDRQLKIRGYRIEPKEIENALLAEPGVKQAVVTSVKSESQQGNELVAYVVGAAKENELLASLVIRLPASHIPSRIYHIEELPVNANGKLDRTRLLASVNAVKSVSPNVISPRNETEQLIVDIWREVLKRDDIDIRAKFLELGGDSFKTLMVFGRLRRHFPNLTIAQLFKYPSVESLANVLGGDNTASNKTQVVQL